jgi:tetratricopeptide (TPR) repeat protein
MIAIQTDDAELAAIPWEFLHDGKDFLIFRYLLVREVPATHAPPPPTAQLWRLVVMGSDPLVEEQYDAQGKLRGLKPVPRLKVAWELDTLRDDLQQSQPPVPFRWQRIAPTRAALIDDLAASEPILFHFVGHGSVVNGTPMLCFDNGVGKLDPQPASELAEQLRGMVMLAFLNACHTADSVEPGANLALTLVQHGIPVVVSNQYRVIDEAAALVARTFYRSLAANMRPAQALYRARLQLKNHLRDQPVQWAIPVIYLMQGYQWPQCPPEPASPLRPIEPPHPVLTALSAPDYQAGHFVGRERELYKLASKFVDDQKKIVTIRGPGGIGKTALVAALAHRLRFVFSDGIVALSLVLPGEQAGLDAADVRRQLARLLGIRVEESSAWPADERAQENILVEHLQRWRRLLLIWDNYETVLWRLGRETDTDASAGVFSAEQRNEATAVQRLVRRLADSGVSMLFTSRQSPVGIPGEVCFPPLEEGQLPGLSAEASEDFMRRWISMRTPKEQFLPRLAAALDHHPLAMQLAITRWDRGQDDEDTFLNNLDHELAQARDPAAPMYQQTSVEINIRLSLNALPSELREALLTLTIIANPIITSLHAAVVWGLEDGQQWQVEIAHRRLEVLQQTSLLQGIDYDSAHNRAQAYSLQPVIAGFLRREAQQREAEQTLDMNVARQRYARWAAMLVAQARDPQQGVNANPELAQFVQFVLPDLAAALPALTDADRGWTYRRAAWVFARMGDLATAQRMIDLATPLAQTDEALLSQVYYQQADLLVTRGDLDQALALYQQSLDLKDRLGDVKGNAATLLMMAHVFVTRGDLDQALALYQQARDLYDRLSDVKGNAATLHAMAHVFVTRGDLDQALALYQQARDLFDRLGDVQGKAATLQAIADVLVSPAATSTRPSPSISNHSTLKTAWAMSRATLPPCKPSLMYWCHPRRPRPGPRPLSASPRPL